MSSIVCAVSRAANCSRRRLVAGLNPEALPVSKMAQPLVPERFDHGCTIACCVVRNMVAGIQRASAILPPHAFPKCPLHDIARLGQVFAA